MLHKSSECCGLEHQMFAIYKDDNINKPEKLTCEKKPTLQNNETLTLSTVSKFSEKSDLFNNSKLSNVSENSRLFTNSTLSSVSSKSRFNSSVGAGKIENSEAQKLLLQNVSENNFLNSNTYYAVITMEKIDGTLTNIEKLSLKNKLHYLKKLYDVIKNLHYKQIIHLDLKPDNIGISIPKYINESTDIEYKIVLLDFGLAEDKLYTRDLNQGTPGYIIGRKNHNITCSKDFKTFLDDFFSYILIFINFSGYEKDLNQIIDWKHKCFIKIPITNTNLNRSIDSMIKLYEKYFKLIHQITNTDESTTVMLTDDYMNYPINHVMDFYSECDKIIDSIK